MDCPNQHGRMKLKSMAREVPFRGDRVKFRAQHFVCTECGIEADDLNLAAENQKALSDAYRRAARLLSGEQIVEGRKKLKWSQEDLAKAANVGIASIKLRIPLNPATDSMGNRPAVPRQSGHPFQGMRPPLWERSDPGVDPILIP
jgi:hypothetical protein